jgi:transcriptional regulator with XRE-family HTH domain
MTWNSSGPLDGRKMLSRDLFPEGHCLPRYPDLTRRRSHGAALCPQEPNPVVHPIREAQLDAISQVSLDGPFCRLAAMEIGQRIRARRTHLKWSLQKVADMIGVTKNAVHLWETGETPEITIENRIRLAEALDMPLSELLPPDALGKDLTVRDPQKKLLLERFDLLSPQQQEAYLRLIVLMREDPNQKG